MSFFKALHFVFEKLFCIVVVLLCYKQILDIHKVAGVVDTNITYWETTFNMKSHKMFMFLHKYAPNIALLMNISFIFASLMMFIGKKGRNLFLVIGTFIQMVLVNNCFYDRKSSTLMIASAYVGMFGMLMDDKY